jgi:hypothetical protein
LRLRSIGVRRSVIALVLIVSILGTTGSPTVLGAHSLLVEWAGCAVGGRQPGPQPVLAERVREHAAARRPLHRPRERPIALPIVTPRDIVPPDTPAGLRPVVIAVIDSGVTGWHPDVAPTRVRRGTDLVNPCGDGRTDVMGHGTAVAGVIVSGTNGAAPDVEILPVRVTLATGRQHPWSSALAIVWAVRNGADIVNMSYSNPDGRPSRLEDAAIALARRHGLALVAAAGNRSDRPAGYPAAYPGVVSVTALDGDGEPSVYASRTGAIDLAAPGSRVLTLAPDGSVITASGTSLAAPLVSAAIARVLAARPDLAPAVAAEVVVRTAAPGPEGLPVLDVDAALQAVCRPGSVPGSLPLDGHAASSCSALTAGG